MHEKRTSARAARSNGSGPAARTGSPFVFLKYGDPGNVGRFPAPRRHTPLRPGKRPRGYARRAMGSARTNSSGGSPRSIRDDEESPSTRAGPRTLRITPRVSTTRGASPATSA